MNGCCDSGPNPATACRVRTVGGYCYCDIECYRYNDCCSDMHEIDCLCELQYLCNTSQNMFSPIPTKITYQKKQKTTAPVVQEASLQQSLCKLHNVSQ